MERIREAERVSEDLERRNIEWTVEKGDDNKEKWATKNKISAIAAEAAWVGSQGLLRQNQGKEVRAFFDWVKSEVPDEVRHKVVAVDPVWVDDSSHSQAEGRE